MPNPTIPLFILPFDHRTSLAKDLLQAEGPLTPQQQQRMVEFRAIVFAGFLRAKKAYTGTAALGVLVDEEFGTAVLHQARKMGIPFALTMEASHRPSFTLANRDWRSRLTLLQPTFAKALVHYLPNDEAHNVLSRLRLRQLSEYCAKHDIDFMLEVLTGQEHDKKKEAAIRQAMQELHADGVHPTLWKLEGLGDAGAWKRLARVAQAPMIVLGHGESKTAVAEWVRTAAASGRVLGFAIGRTIFLTPLQNFVTGKTTREEAVKTIGENLLYYIRQWEIQAAKHA